jgi:hypothetical protein
MMPIVVVQLRLFKDGCGHAKQQQEQELKFIQVRPSIGNQPSLTRKNQSTNLFAQQSSLP